MIARDQYSTLISFSRSQHTHTSCARNHFQFMSTHSRASVRACVRPYVESARTCPTSSSPPLPTPRARALLGLVCSHKKKVRPQCAHQYRDNHQQHRIPVHALGGGGAAGKEFYRTCVDLITHMIWAVFWCVREYARVVLATHLALFVITQRNQF